MRPCSLAFDIALAVVVAHAVGAMGQSESALGVATVRLNPPHEVCDSGWSPPGIGSFSAHCVKVPFLIHMAFGIDENQIEGKEKWMDLETFDIVAKPSINIPLTREQLKPVLQDLLKDRFHLITHDDIETRKGFALSCAKGGPKTAAKQRQQAARLSSLRRTWKIGGLNWSMPYLASMLQNPAGLPVVDQTGLKGAYDITLNFAPDLEQDPSLPSLFTALRESLGLELKSMRVPVPILVIDHVDRIPTEN